jgi:hypothetical protein
LFPSHDPCHNLSQEVTAKEGNTKSSLARDYRARSYCFTLNNPNNDEIQKVKNYCVTKSQCHIIGSEIGESGTPHLQGYIRFKNAVRFTTLQKALGGRAHIEKCKGTEQENLDYCSKDGNIISKTKTFQEQLDEEILEEDYKNVVWKDWQQELIDLVNTKPDKRTINWYWDSKGNVGKSYLCKYLDIKHKGIILCSGKFSDIANQVNTMIQQEIKPSIIICDVPRTHSDYINYNALEKLKDGHLYSGKYEGGKCRFPSPHVIVFANQEPDIFKMSQDRWNIKCLDN